MVYEYIEEEKEKEPAAPKVIKTPPRDDLSFFEKLLMLIVAWKYFHFTGKAIAEGKKIPKDWLKIRDRILPKKVRELLSDTPKAPKKSSYKVVDLATKEPIKVQ